MTGAGLGRLASSGILAATAVFSLSFGAVFVLIADLQDRIGFPDWGLGLIVAASFLASFAAQVTLARYADRGRARLLLGSGLALAATGMVGFALGDSLVALVVARSVMGLGSGMFLPAARRVMASASPGREAEVLGRLGSAEVGGFIAGPPVAALVAEVAGLRAPFLLLAGLALALSPTLAKLSEPVVVDERPGRGVLTVLIRLPGVRAGLAIGVGLYATVGVFETLWSRFLADLGASTGFVAISLLLFGLPMVVGMPFGGRLADRIGPQRCGFAALLCGLPLIVSYGRTEVLWVLVIIAVVHASIDSVTMPSGLGAVARAAPASLTAAGQGLYGAVCSVAAGLASAGAAPLYGSAGAAWTWAAAALAVGAVVALGALLGRHPARAGLARVAALADNPATVRIGYGHVALLDAFAQVTPGLEPIADAELRGLGIGGLRRVRGGIGFGASPRQLYAANLWLRTVSRVLVRRAAFPARSFAQLERRVSELAWDDWLAPGPVRWRVSSSRSALYHSGAVAERLARGLGRPDPPPDAPDSPDDLAQLVVVRLVDDRLTVSVDSSGEGLHRRGWRLAGAKAPLRETLAAAMVLGCGWDPAAGEALVDPLCGSGTVAIEAASFALDCPPGSGRTFAFQRWPSFEPGTWASVTGEARARARPAGSGPPIMATDRAPGAVDAAPANAARAGFAAAVDVRQAPLAAFSAQASAGWIVTNPPYGRRLGAGSDLRDLYATLGNLLRGSAAVGWRAALLVADPVLAGQLHVGLEERFRTTNGGLPVRLLVSRPPGSRPGSRRGARRAAARGAAAVRRPPPTGRTG